MKDDPSLNLATRREQLRLRSAQLREQIAVPHQGRRERDPERMTTEVEIHVQKVKSKYVGRLGMARLHWDHLTGCYSDINTDSHGRIVQYSFTAERA